MTYDIEIAFFDLFFTLVKPSYAEKEEDNEYYDLDLSREEWEEMAEDEELYLKRAAGKIEDPVSIIKEVLEKYDIVRDEPIISNITEKRIKRFQNCLKQVDKNIIDTLEYLSKKGIRMCLISSSDVIDKIGWDSSPLNSYFEHTIFSCDVGVLKPDKEIYDIGLKKMGVEAENAVFIGDGGSGELQGAREVGLKTVLVTHFLGDMRNERIESNSEYADLVVDRFEDIIKYI